MIVDDTIAEKPYSDENDIVCWHYDHTSGHTVKGMAQPLNHPSKGGLRAARPRRATLGLVTALYVSNGMALPAEYRLIAKTEMYVDKKDGKTKRRSPVSKNELYRQMLLQTKINQIPFKYVLNDIWFASAENMNYVKHDLKKEFVMPLKTNGPWPLEGPLSEGHFRNVALSADDKRQGIYVRVDEVEIEANTVRQVYLEGVSFPLLLAKQVFQNKDGSIGVLYLVTSDLTLTYESGPPLGHGITSLYQKRWTKVALLGAIAARPPGEPFHKSLKQNAALERSPAHTVKTQTNHIFASLCAFIKLEKLKVKTKANHFELKSRLYLAAVQSAFDQLHVWQPVKLAA